MIGPEVDKGFHAVVCVVPCTKKGSGWAQVKPWLRAVSACLTEGCLFQVTLMHPRCLIQAGWVKCFFSQANRIPGIYLFIYLFFIISWRLITLQYCSGFCHTLKWISHGFTCIPHPDPPSHLPLHPVPLGGFKTINADVDATGSENKEREQTHRREGVENQAETSQNVEIQAS